MKNSKWKCLLGSAFFLIMTFIFVAPSAAIIVTTTKVTFTEEEPVVVEYSGLPGNNQDWITIVPKGTAADKWGEWFYTKGKQSGRRNFGALSPGDYEVRAYVNWPKGGFVIQARSSFSVVLQHSTPSDVLTTDKQTYAVGEDIVLIYENMPGNAQDWITVVKAGSSAEEWGEWFYTKGKRTGKKIYSNMKAGDYEARAYFNWPAGGYKIMHRHRFAVR
ncbi:hypothetical protein [Maridesulfovibrio sp.]|uniref:hypothetical protein n=1 Tax=Maridesulfovibrio sp. TaxID=2795000 RepID=UPI003BAAEB53